MVGQRLGRQRPTAGAAAVAAAALLLSACGASVDVETQRESAREGTQMIIDALQDNHDWAPVTVSAAVSVVPCAEGERGLEVHHLALSDVAGPTAGDFIDTAYLMLVTHQQEFQTVLEGELLTNGPELITHELPNGESLASRHLVYVVKDGPNAGLTLSLDLLAVEGGAATARVAAETACG